MNAIQVIQELRPKFAQLPGINVYMQMPPLIRSGGMASKALYQYSLQDTDVQELFDWAPILMDELAKHTEYFQDVTSDLQIATPQVNVEIDRDKAAALGVTAQQIENALYDAYGEMQASTIYADVAEYWVVFEVLPQFQRDPDALSQLYIASSITGTNGTPKLVPLSAVAKLTRNLGPTSISHVGQLPSVTLSFNLAPGISLGTAVAQVQKIEADMHLPETITGSFQGAAAVFLSSLTGMFALLVVSIIVIYIILGILYESFIHPITILSGLPSAGFGALLTLMLFRLDLNIYGFVGLIMLIGIVKKNAIMMIDFAINAQREHGKNPARCDSRRLPAAVPPDHDDHHVRADGHVAHRARPGRRRRSPALARSGRCRRIGRVAMPDALHHARDLSLSGISPPMVTAQTPENAGSARGLIQGWNQSYGRIGVKIRVHPCPSVVKLSPQLWNTKRSSDWKRTSSSKRNRRCGAAAPTPLARRRTPTSAPSASACPVCCPCPTTRRCA